MARKNRAKHPGGMDVIAASRKVFGEGNFTVVPDSLAQILSVQKPHDVAWRGLEARFPVGDRESYAFRAAATWLNVRDQTVNRPERLRSQRGNTPLSSYVTGIVMSEYDPTNTKQRKGVQKGVELAEGLLREAHAELDVQYVDPKLIEIAPQLGSNMLNGFGVDRAGAEYAVVPEAQGVRDSWAS